MKNDTDLGLNAKLLQVICQLHEWESRNLDLATTQAGRYLYLNIAKQLQDNRSGPSTFLKGIYLMLATTARLLHRIAKARLLVLLL